MNYKIKNDKLTKSETIETQWTKEEIEGQIKEYETRVNACQYRLNKAKADLEGWQNLLKEYNKLKELEKPKKL